MEPITRPNNAIAHKARQLKANGFYNKSICRECGITEQELQVVLNRREVHKPKPKKKKRKPIGPRLEKSKPPASDPDAVKAIRLLLQEGGDISDDVIRASFGDLVSDETLAVIRSNLAESA